VKDRQMGRILHARENPAMARTRLTVIASVALSLSALAPLSATPEGTAQEPLEHKVTAISREKGQLGDQITVRITNLSDWLTSNGTPMPLTEASLSKYILYLNNIPLPNMSALRRNGSDGLVFLLQRPDKAGDEAEKAREAWATVLGKPDGFTKKVSVSVGYGVQGPLETSAPQFEFKVIPIDRWFWASLFAFLILFAMFCLLMRISNLIRDPGLEPAGAAAQTVIPSNPLQWRRWISHQWQIPRKPYSLAMTQMAVWTFLIFGSYLFLWVVTQDRDVLPVSSLVLLGISAGTALSAVLIESGKQASARDLRAQKEALDASVTDLRNRLNSAAAEEKERIQKDMDAKQKTLTEIEASLAGAVPPETNPVSKGFLTDILSDGHGISLHRFQIVVWTTVLGIVFVASVYNRLLMPTFSEPLLALMGVSGATYIGFKFPEASKK
jgi:hypothetical protein